MEPWRQAILERLQETRRAHSEPFEELIAQHNKLFDYANSLRAEVIQLSIQNEKLRDIEDQSTTNIDAKIAEKIQHLEQKVLHQQEELTELHRRKGENSQAIIDLNNQLIAKNKILIEYEKSLDERQKKIVSLMAEISLFERNNKELALLNDNIRDEHQALQMAFSSLENKLRKVQDENREVIERLKMYKARDAERLNEENDSLMRRREAKVRKDIEDACQNETEEITEETTEVNLMNFPMTIPSQIYRHCDAHDGEVNAVKWSPTDRLVATGGADRKVKLWDFSKGGSEHCRSVLIGSNAGVMSVAFDSTGSLILAASGDFASRVWGISDFRLKHTLTGHCGKVMAAKFLGDAHKVATGSHDRTLKIWDLRSRACTETKFAGSSCNDLVTSDGSGSLIISGHFDKSIRVWDNRSDSSADIIELTGKITSLDLTRDAKYLLCCVRDDTLKVLDLRMNQVVKSFRDDNFKVVCDWSRASFSPNGQYIAVGSADGNTMIWNVHTGKVETRLNYSGSVAPVIAAHWHNHGTFLASVDKSKKLLVWGGM